MLQRARCSGDRAPEPQRPRDHAAVGSCPVRGTGFQRRALPCSRPAARSAGHRPGRRPASVCPSYCTLFRYDAGERGLIAGYYPRLIITAPGPYGSAGLPSRVQHLPRCWGRDVLRTAVEL
ncbi:hypothetical protein HBB16_13965 [Pseudonocardia sp. MCCB 268]|nr:hypothetical protein [Pseudonocardia cytotoxica]